ncbi:hypothetical protein ISN76_07690 [Dyella halodurans]|uniref:Flagellar assembly protein FliH/Type III secretion system HrpE domain-containing protein n=1 Tax=Dyella halodurans TaxID=1920171 RepID=A0ABV9C3G7_9GAMM|nr:hypothetical protein [Dyella halodurans]
MIRRLTDDASVSSAVLHLPVAMTHGEPAAADDADAALYGDGYREGFEAGEADALREAAVRLEKVETELRIRLEEAEAALLQARDQWDALAAGLANAEQARAANMEKDAFEIALLALSAVFGENTGDRELLGRLVTQVISDHRSDALCLQVAESDLALLPSQIDGIRVESIAGLAPGACALLTARGRVETSIEARLDAIYRSMVQALKEASS